MKKILTTILLTAILASCSSPHKTQGSMNGPETSGGSATSKQDGSSFDNAVYIREKSESKGVNAEYTWLKEHYPGYKMKSQSLSFHDKKPYDLLNIVTADGESKTIYFDISGFFGKF